MAAFTTGKPTLEPLVLFQSYLISLAAPQVHCYHEKGVLDEQYVAVGKVYNEIVAVHSS